MKTRTLKLNKLETPIVFWGLILAIILFGALYVYLVNQTVWNVVGLQNDQKSIAVLNTKTGALEASYISMKSAINLGLAQSMGFSATTNTKYITRTTLGQLSSNPVE